MRLGIADGKVPQPGVAFKPSSYGWLAFERKRMSPLQIKHLETQASSCLRLDGLLRMALRFRGLLAYGRTLADGLAFQRLACVSDGCLAFQ